MMKTKKLTDFLREMCESFQSTRANEVLRLGLMV